MDMKTIDLCQRAFSEYLDGLVQEKLKHKQHRDGIELIEAPLIGGWYPADDLHKVKHKVTKALLARAWFGTHAGVQLPLNDEEIARLQHSNDTGDGSPLRNLVGLFAASLKESNWNYERHPSFDTLTGLG